MNKRVLIIGLMSLLTLGNTVASASSKKSDKVETSSPKEKKVQKGFLFFKKTGLYDILFGKRI